MLAVLLQTVKGKLSVYSFARTKSKIALSGITVSGIRGLYAFLGYRHVSNYRLDGADPAICASGLDVLDFSMRQRLRKWVDFNFSIDNLTNKKYFETQNFFESRATPTAPIAARIHGTPGYSIGFTAGLTFHWWAGN